MRPGLARAAPAPMPWGWRIILSLIVFVGVCEMLMMTPVHDLVPLPGWLGGITVFVAFIAFLFLGFTLNMALAVVVPLVLWRGQGWPFWQAMLPALPYWMLFTAFIPPW